MPLSPIIPHLIVDMYDVFGPMSVIDDPGFHPPERAHPRQRVHSPAERGVDEMVFAGLKYDKKDVLLLPAQFAPTPVHTELYTSYAKASDGTYIDLDLNPKSLRELNRFTRFAHSHDELSAELREAIGDKQLQSLFAAIDQFAHMTANYRLNPRDRYDETITPPTGILVCMRDKADHKQGSLTIGVFAQQLIAHVPTQTRYEKPTDEALRVFNDASLPTQPVLWKYTVVAFKSSLLERVTDESKVGERYLVSEADFLIWPLPNREVHPSEFDWANATILGSGANGKAVKITWNIGSSNEETGRPAYITHPTLHKTKVVIALKALSPNHRTLTLIGYRREASVGIIAYMDKIATVTYEGHTHYVKNDHILPTMGWLIKGNHFGIITKFMPHELGRAIARLVSPDDGPRLKKELEDMKDELVTARRAPDSVDYVSILEKRIATLITRIEEFAVKTLATEHTPRQLATVFVDASHGLTYLHALGYVHRDIKPDNILIDDRGAGRLADFGYVTHMYQYAPVSGSRHYMPSYIPPLGNPHYYGDGYTDVFALAKSIEEFCANAVVKSDVANAALFTKFAAIAQTYLKEENRATLTAVGMWMALGNALLASP